MTSYRTTLVALVGIAAVLVLGLVVPEHAGDGQDAIMWIVGAVAGRGAAGVLAPKAATP